MFSGLQPEALSRRGVASGFDFTVRALLFILVGHEIHHRRVLEERYLGQALCRVGLVPAAEPQRSDRRKATTASASSFFSL